MNIKFDGAREFVDCIRESKKIWISVNDPVLKIIKVIDENLEDVYEMNLSDFKESEIQLTEVELKALREKNYGELSGVKLTEHQKFLLSPEHWQSMANYLQKKFNDELVAKSLLRLNGKVEILPALSVPCYDFDPEKGAFCFDETSDNILRIERGKSRTLIPIFEISQTIQKECENIWDVTMDDFMGCGILDHENNLYKRIMEEIGEKVKIIIPIKTALTVLPCTSWIEKKAGFSAFECLGIGIYPE